MDNQEIEQQKIDIFILLEDFLRMARRLWLLGLVLVLVCGGGLMLKQRNAFRTTYEAHASFTVRVANPLYASVSSYNDKTAQVMADTFPSILTSGVLQERVMEELGITGVPTMAISATAQSSILTLTVRDPDPQRAYDVLNAVIACYPEVSEFVVGSTVLVLLDESGVPTVPVAVFNYRSAMIKGAVAGAALWCALVVGLILLKNTVHNEEELRKILNLPCLGKIPRTKVTRKRPTPLIHRLRKDAGFVESVRLLRLRVEKAMEEENRKILLVSSAIPGEGKTTVAVNLAVSMAQKGKKVLLIDCDLRNPSVAKTLSAREKPLTGKCSLPDYLKGINKVSEIVQATSVPGLMVVSGGSGGKSENADLLFDKRMALLLKAARKVVDYIILDTPPCSMLADASELAELAECGLMVIRQDYAGREQILDGVQRLSDGNLPIIGCVFNNIRKSVSGKYGYGGYGYGYGYGYGGYGYGKKK